MKLTLINDDYKNVLKNYPDKYFDLALVDPPFGIGPVWEKSSRDQFFKKGKNQSYQNLEIPPKNYFRELQRISLNQVIFGGNYYTEFLKPTNSWIIWDKVKNANASFMSEAELAWTSFNKVTKIARFQWDGAKKCEKIYRKIHPHQRPVKLYHWVLKNYTNPGLKIIDTHMGSGSTCIAAMDFGAAEYHGIEIDQDYFESTKKRIDIHKSQLKCI